MYIKRTYTAGLTKEVEKIYSSKYGKNHKRAGQEKPTPEKVKKYNAKLAEDRFRRKMNTNFGADDLHIVLTYIKSKRPPPDRAAKNLKKAIAKARKEYRKQGLELKYMAVTGYGEDDGISPEDKEKYGHDEVAMHHHIVVNYIDIRIWTEIWKEFGRAWVFPLDDTGDYTLLANYFIEHGKQHFREPNGATKKRYSCSRNLKEPEIREKAVNAESWRKNPVPEKGYYIDRDSVRYGVSEITGYPYQFYRMIKIQGKRRDAG